MYTLALKNAYALFGISHDNIMLALNWFLTSVPMLKRYKTKTAIRHVLSACRQREKEGEADRRTDRQRDSQTDRLNNCEGRVRPKHKSSNHKQIHKWRHTTLKVWSYSHSKRSKVKLDNKNNQTSLTLFHLSQNSRQQEKRAKVWSNQLRPLKREPLIGFSTEGTFLLICSIRINTLLCSSYQTSDCMSSVPLLLFIFYFLFTYMIYHGRFYYYVWFVWFAVRYF